jgi:uncharacterized protein (TIGR04255 family)
MVERDTMPLARDLVNKPLAEAILELRWALQPATPSEVNPQAVRVTQAGLALQVGSQQAFSDPGFKILVGLFYNSVSKRYPYAQDLPVAQVPENLTPYIVRHQFRASPNGWPLLQLGPGVLTVNQTTDYSWKDFRERVVHAVTSLYECYPRTIALLKPALIVFRYVNTIPFDYRRESITDFLESQLHTIVRLDSNLSADAKDTSTPNSLALRLSLPVHKPEALATVSFGSGMRDQSPVVIWELMLQSEGEYAPQQPAVLESWIDDAHSLLEKWFFTLCRGKLLNQFEGSHGNHQD